MLRIAYPDTEILKLHRLELFEDKLHTGSRVIATIRNPLDMISSSIQRHEMELSQAVVEQQLAEYERLGIRDMLELKNSPQVIVLRYEDFAFDWDFAYRKIEEFEGRKISEEARRLCRANYSLDAVYKKAESLGSFWNYDKQDHIHGKHVSRFRGKIGYYREYLDDDMIDRIHRRFAEIFSVFDYEVAQDS